MFQGMDGVLGLSESFVAASELEYMRPIVLSLFWDELDSMECRPMTITRTHTIFRVVFVNHVNSANHCCYYLLGSPTPSLKIVCPT